MEQRGGRERGVRLAARRANSRLLYISVLIPILAAAFVYSRREHDPTVTAFVEWLAQGGALHPSLRIAPSPLGGLGAFATKYIAPGELTITLPRRLMITAADAPAALTRHPAVNEARTTYPELQGMLPC